MQHVSRVATVKTLPPKEGWGKRLSSSDPASPSTGRSAFTMTEMVIVVMVMGIVAATAAPVFWNSLVYHRVEAAAQRLKADLELVRHTARLTSAAQTIEFTNSTYTLPAAVKHLDDPNASYAVDLSASPYEITTLTANFSGDETVTFNGYGVPTSGGTVVLTCNGHSSTVTLNAATGEVTVSSIHTAPAAVDGG